MKKALIVGCNGQDGRYLAEHLEAKAYTVAGIDCGVTRALPGTRCIDIQDKAQVLELMRDFAPDEVYYLAAFHHSAEDLPLEDDELIRRSFEINTLALNHFLHAIGAACRQARLFYAASSHVFGDPPGEIQDEETPLNPTAPYGISKTAGLHLCRYYRRRRQVYASVGILYNHESPRRSPAFVSRKVAQAAARIKRRVQEELVIGDLDAKVDWGYAPDYVDAMWRILQLDRPDDFIIASGALHSVQELVSEAFAAAGLDWKAHVRVDPAVRRKEQGKPLRGSAARLESRTGWRPATSFRDMVHAMVKAEMENEL